MSIDKFYEEQEDGFSPPGWDDTHAVEEEIIRFDKITEDYALKIVLIPEHINMDIMKSEHFRKYAAHDEFWDVEYFPYVLYKVNGSRKALKIKDFYGRFTLPGTIPVDPVSGVVEEGIDDVIPLFQISKMIYSQRNLVEKDRKYLQRFVEPEEELNGRDIFYNIKDKILFHLDVDEWIATVLSLWIMGTHVYYLFDSYAYIYALAELGSGKSRMLKLIKLLSRMGQLWVTPRPSPLFRTVHSLQPTIALDETEKLNDDDMAELLALLNAGYERGAVVPRTNMDKMMAEYFDAYCPKAMATTKDVSNVLQSRCLRIPILRSMDPKFAEREPFQAYNKSVLEEIRESLEFWAIDQGPDIAKMDKKEVFDKYKGRFENVPPRTLQIMTPLLTIYEVLGLDTDVCRSYDVDGKECEYTNEIENLRKALDYQMTEHKSVSVKESDQKIIMALYECVLNETSIGTKTISRYLILDDESEQKYYSPNRIGKTLKKFSIPSRTMNGRKEYFPHGDRTKRVEVMAEILKRYSIEADPEELKKERQAMEEAMEKKREKAGLESYDDNGSD